MGLLMGGSCSTRRWTWSNVLSAMCSPSQGERLLYHTLTPPRRSPLCDIVAERQPSLARRGYMSPGLPVMCATSLWYTLA